MASNQPAVSNTAPRCFRHHKTWQTHVQWTLNKLRDRLIPKPYLGRFNNLLCTCSQGNPDIVSAWDEVTDNHLQEAVTFIHQHIVQNPNNEIVVILKHVIKLLCQDKEINEENRTDIQVAPRSSALKFLYLLRKAIEKDFKIMEPRKPKAPVQQAKKKMREELKLEVELDEYPPELLGQLIGDRGRNIMIFMKREKCHVHLAKGTSVSGRATVMATIKKTTTNKHILSVIADELKKYAKDTRESVESYQPADREQFTPEVRAVYEQIDEMNMDEVRDEYIELLEAMGSVTATSTFNDVGQYYKDNNNTRFNAVTKKLSLVDQIRAFNDYKVRIGQAPQTPTGITNIRSLSLGQQKSQSSGRTVPEGGGASASASQVSKNPEEPDAKRCKKI